MIERRSTGRASLLVLALLAPSCTDEIETSAIIEIQSELGRELTRIDVEIRDARDRTSEDGFSFDSERTPRYRPPFSFRVVPQGSEASPFVVRATAFAGDEYLAEMKLRVRFVRGEVIRRTLRLWGACRGLRCGDGETCDPRDASCASLDGMAEAGLDPGVAGRDAASEDAGAKDDASQPDAAADAGDRPTTPDPPPSQTAGTGGTAGAAQGGAGAGGAGSGGTGGAGPVAGSAGSAGESGTSGGIGGASGAAASGGVGGSITALGPVVDGPLLTEPSDWASVTRDGRDYIIQNSVFNPDASQTVRYLGTSFTVVSITGSSSYGLSFPAVYIGNAYGMATAGSKLPMQVSAIQSILASWSHNAGSVDGVYNARHAAWFGVGPGADVTAPTGGYLEVWYYTHPELRPEGAEVARAVLIPEQLGSWDVWVGTCSGRPCITYLRTTPTTIYSGDLQPFLADAVTRPGAIQPSWYLNTVFAGFELHEGGAGLTANNVELEVR